jgi:hypothetical protein
MSAHGRLLVQARVTLRKKQSILSAYSIAGLWDNFPRLSAGMHDKPAVDELVRWVSGHLLITNIWIARVISFFRKPLERVGSAGALKVGRGYRFSFSYSVTDIEILAVPVGNQTRTYR